jgi:curved DNA-binding protein CbpA
MKTAYDVLGVPRNASDERIRTAFRKAAKACHPDHNAEDPTADLQIRQVIAAYELLRIPHRRAAYDRRLRERRRERARQCAMAAVASVLRGSIVALAVSLSVSLSVSQSNTQDASAPPTPHTESAKVRLDASQVPAADNRGREEVNKGRKSDWDAPSEHLSRHRPQAAGSFAPTAGPPELYAALARQWGLQGTGEPIASAGLAHEAEFAPSEPVVRSNAAAPLSSNSLKKPSSKVRGRNHGQRIKVTANQHRYNRLVTSDESQSHYQYQRGGQSNPGPSETQHTLPLPRGPTDISALLFAKLTPKTFSAHPSKVTGAGGRAGSHNTQQIVGSNRAEAAAENPHRLCRTRHNAEAKTTVRNKLASRTDS